MSFWFWWNVFVGALNLWCSTWPDAMSPPVSLVLGGLCLFFAGMRLATDMRLR